MKKIFVSILILMIILGLVYKKSLVRIYQGIKIHQVSKERAKYYVLPDGVQLQDISDTLIADSSIPEELKHPIISGERKIVIFKYLSGTEYVAGYISYLTEGEHPSIIFLRGGNGFFGIMRPNNRFSYLKGYNVIGTLYRGNIYGGKDEFGGNDIQDVENLVRYIPTLEQRIRKKLQPPYDIMGVSRGAMEMVIALCHSDYLQSLINHAISISGNLDLQESMTQRAEMKYLFNSLFKDSKDVEFLKWLEKRDPVFNAKNIPKSLKLLIIYGLSDNRVSLEEQKNFKYALEQEGKSATFITVPDANHGFDNHFLELENIILNFIQHGQI